MFSSKSDMKPLKGYEIAELLSKSGPVYQALLGVVSIDQLPKSIDFHQFVVSNLSTSDQEGKLHITKL